MSARPDLHTQKYDRQLRLWAASGQRALETASVLVIGGNSTATQVLKNLVLPGIGKFTVQDEATVSPKDLTDNFFLTSDTLGKPRAECVVRLLQELNSDVAGEALTCPLADVDLTAFSLVIATRTPDAIQTLSDTCWANSIPLIWITSSGFYAAIRIQYEEATVVETHPESLVDLRLHSPFDALVRYCETFDYASMDSEQHTHVPAVVIIIKALLQLGAAPADAAARKRLVGLILAEQRHADEDNFEEAVALFRRFGARPTIPDEVQEILTLAPEKGSATPFWALAVALKAFYDTEHVLPLSGALPDMKAHSSKYIELQNIYKQKAAEDLALFTSLLPQEPAIPAADIATFVKHAAHLRFLPGVKISEDLSRNSCLRGKVNDRLVEASFSESPDRSVYIYLAFAAAERFRDTHHRYPDIDDLQDLSSLAKQLAVDLEMDLASYADDLHNVVWETVRAGFNELPQISAFVGGVVAQEAIKLITGQYIPMRGTCIFDGIRSGVTVLN